MCFSARSSKSTRNHAAYKKLHGRQGSETPRIPALPSQLVSLALLPLPDPRSFFFAQALQSAAPLDESDLGRWDSDPPFPEASYVPSELYMERLIDVMHGRRLRQQGERDRAREVQCMGMSSVERQATISLELKTVLEEWRRLNSFLPEYRVSVWEVRMAEHLLQWRARTVYHLKEQWEAVV